MKRFTEITVIALIYLGLAFQMSQASLFLRQPSVDLYLSKGQVFEGGVILDNTSDKELKVKAAVVDGLDKEGKPVKQSISKLAKLGQDEFTIPAGGSKDLKFKIEVPSNAQGSYWGGLVYTYHYGQVQGPDDITLNIKMNIEEPFRFTVKGTEVPAIALRDAKMVYNNGTLNIKVKAVNTGNVYYDVRPSILIIGKNGKIEKKIKSSTFKAYPQEEYPLEYNNEVILTRGAKDVILAFDYGEDKIETFSGKIQVK
ncbi:MAG: hypothetical protein WC490_08095 [Candidatus Margulisiibacteriota bacterium]